MREVEMKGDPNLCKVKIVGTTVFWANSLYPWQK